MTDQELQEQRVKVHDAMGAIVDTAQADKRTLTAEESERWDKLEVEYKAIKGTIDRRTRQAAETADLEKSAGRQSSPATPGAGEQRGGLISRDTVRAVAERGETDRREALRGWFLYRSSEPITERQTEAAQRCGIDLRSDVLHLSFSVRAPHHVRDLDHLEVRAQSTGTTTAGGFTIAQGFVRELEAAMLAFGGMRETSRVIRTEGVGDLPIPTANDTSQKGAILAENTQVAEQDITFGQIVLKSFKYSSKMIRVSVELLADSAIDLEGFIGAALGERIGRITNDHFTVGVGTTEPFGIVPKAGLGVTGAAGTATSITYSDLVGLQHSVDPAYRSSARWMFHDTTLRALKRLVDTQGRPLWMNGIAVSEPDTILGWPYSINQSMPVMAANAKSILAGALNKYLIRDVVPITLLRLEERFADWHQVAFLAFSRHDGNLLDAGVSPVRYYANGAT